MRTTKAFEHEAERMAYRDGCPVCGERPDTCLGHGEIGDPTGAEILEDHDDDIHDRCHRLAECQPDDLASIRARVERGALLLDEVEPQWWDRVSTQRLQMALGCECDIGQLDATEEAYGDYSQGMRIIVIPHFERPANATGNWFSDFLGFAHGFYTRNEADYEVLDTEWRLAIEERQQG